MLILPYHFQNLPMAAYCMFLKTCIPGLKICMPPANLCGDNGAMIAWAGIERMQLGLSDDLTFAARPRWPLDVNAGRVENAKA